MKYTIYKHTNKINGKSYIGQTLQVDLRIRFKNGRGYHKQKIFFKAILKYGWENFIHEVLEIVDSKEQANARERYYIKLYNTYVGFENAWGYNATPGGDDGCGYLLAKEIYQIDLDGNIIAAYESKMEAARQIGVSNNAGIALSCRNLASRTAKGYYWCNAVDYENFCIIFAEKQEEQTRLKQLQEQKNIEIEQKKLLAFSVCQFDSTGSLIAEYDSMSEAEVATGINHSSISLCCNGKASSAGGYYWCFLRDRAIVNFSGLKPEYEKEILQLDKEKNIIARFTNMFEAQRQTGLVNIHTVCLSDKLSSTGGYYWCFADQYENFVPAEYKYKTKQIVQKTMADEIITVFKSASEAAKILGLQQPLIVKCCKGERKSTGGFKWSYI